MSGMLTFLRSFGYPGVSPDAVREPKIDFGLPALNRSALVFVLLLQCLALASARATEHNCWGREATFPIPTPPKITRAPNTNEDHWIQVDEQFIATTRVWRDYVANVDKTQFDCVVERREGTRTWVGYFVRGRLRKAVWTDDAAPGATLYLRNHKPYILYFDDSPGGLWRIVQYLKDGLVIYHEFRYEEDNKYFVP